MEKPKSLRKIHYSSDFEKSLKKASPNIQRKVDKCLEIFKKNAFDPRLKTHKPKGKLSKYWSLCVDRKWRILFAFTNGDVVLLDIGLHNIYD